ncbi:sialic acid-binding Ig-like lectin 14 [Tiliqua scincoides]|uniref:sialic acid-binding Ig-like lectin 14 n=1 Tax=Tiliqua scincoides TaxID=71010 RepID=UPI00346360A3
MTLRDKFPDNFGLLHCHSGKKTAKKARWYRDSKRVQTHALAIRNGILWLTSELKSVCSPKKKMGKPLATLVLGLISMSQLWEGVQCNGLKLHAPNSVSVQKGLCVAIPCSFTYSHPFFTNADTLNGYWYEFGKQHAWNPAFATSDGSKEIAQDARGRFRLSDKLEEGNCSLFITDAQESDQKAYYFRIEKGRGRYSFPNKISVTVTAKPEPKIQIPGELRAGQPVNLTCTAASCPWKPPQISWEFARNISGILSNGTNTLSLVSTFAPSAADNNQTLTCRVTYSSESASPVICEERIYLNVKYPPQRPRISGKLIHKSGGEKNLTGLSQTEAQEGDSLQLCCEAEGNPLPGVTWVHRSHSKPEQSPSENPLTLSVKQQDMGGYTCRAQNTEGSSETTFQVYMAYSPKVCSQANTSCWREDDGLWCNCSICSYPRPEIQWVVNGETVDGNSSDKEMVVTSWYMTDQATSTLNLKGAWNGHRSILCRGNSSSGETSMNFLLFNFKEDSLKQNLTSGVVGALIMFAIVAIIILIVVVSRNQKCRRTSKSTTDPELSPDRSMLVFNGNPSDVKGSNVTTPPNQKEAKGVPEEPKKPEKSPDECYADPQDLYYATVQFSGLKPVLEVTSEEGTTEYAEIRTS